MKTRPTTTLIHLAAVALAWICASSANAQLTIPSDGSDGEFHPLEDVVVDLSQAVDGNWDDDNTADAGRGIYDRNQWAVVFKYSSVTIPDGVRVSFTNHPSRAPVVWLVQGDVTIIGPGDGSLALHLNGRNGVPHDGEGRDVPREPGPGGFRGGSNLPALFSGGSGLGVGGNYRAGGSYHGSYGNPRIVPLVGGSGGGAGYNSSGGSAGGAILIACSGTATISGKIHANGGSRGGDQAGGGSGGAFRIIANEIAGDGEVMALGGRIRLETNTLSPDLSSIPETIAVAPGSIPLIWPPSNAPKVRILSVAAAAVPDDPTANLTTGSDIGIQNDGAVEILVETTNFPIEGIVQVRKSPKFGQHGWYTASYVSGNNAKAIWRVQTAFSAGFSTLQARATAP